MNIIEKRKKEIEEIRNITKKMGDNDIQNYINYQECKSKAKGMSIILTKWLKQVEDEIEFLNTVGFNYQDNWRLELQKLNLKIQELTTLKEDLIKDIKELEEVQ